MVWNSETSAAEMVPLPLCPPSASQSFIHASRDDGDSGPPPSVPMARCALSEPRSASAVIRSHISTVRVSIKCAPRRRLGRGRLLLAGGVLGGLQPALEPVLLRLHRLAHELFPIFAARPLTLVLGELAGELLPGVHRLLRRLLPAGHPLGQRVVLGLAQPRRRVEPSLRHALLHVRPRLHHLKTLFHPFHDRASHLF